MDVNTLDSVIEMYTNHLLQGDLEGFKIEISPEIKDELAAIALYLDSKTVRASGEIEEFYEGYKRAAFDVLTFMGVEFFEDRENKLIKIMKSNYNSQLQEELKKSIWG
ncbi:MAG: hypothetical protein F4Y78_07350 [Candidatus Dadabacteria bacterium]|nr:hypothetical protein [Candidatus Dadabacteria bacterium]MYA48089.1 hypothetical protein [Candidatus Dadabacteria bacterium]MYC40301.1 hypothetical protein [Candidatus Dadabacteria bacterium]MYF48486.1 hypothetical protein [Candidatus Dadabacteria bacterium]MYG83454.1 hypothetical protein [Candidatus Dadabacteria bacterium]